MTNTTGLTGKELQEGIAKLKTIKQIVFKIPSPDPKKYPDVHGLIRHDEFLDKLGEGLVMMDTNFIEGYQIVGICSQSFYVRAKRKGFKAAAEKFQKKSEELQKRIEMYSEVESMVDGDALLEIKKNLKK